MDDIHARAAAPQLVDRRVEGYDAKRRYASWQRENQHVVAPHREIRVVDGLTSTPASAIPTRRPISHAIAACPPAPSTSARRLICVGPNWRVPDCRLVANLLSLRLPIAMPNHTYTVEFRIVGDTLDPVQLTPDLGLKHCQTRIAGSVRFKGLTDKGMWAYNGLPMRPPNGSHWKKD
jgi:hypothetical protein